VFRLVLSFKGMELKSIPLAPGSLLVGSDPECDIHVDSLALQPRHTIVLVTEEGVAVRDLAPQEGTFVNEERVTGEKALKPGDIIRIGKHHLQLEEGEHFEADPEPEPVAAPPPAAEATAAEASDELPEPPPDADVPEAQAQRKSAWLQIITGQNVGKTISLNRKLTNLGKPGVQTAVIAHRNEGFFLSHLEGEHSPKVGGVSIGDKSWVLTDGDIIQIGNVKMQFYLQ